jgi:uncharacterized protein (TIGR01777 family)
MRIFVTGASGLLGLPLCSALAAEGHEVIALSRAARQQGEHAKSSRGALRWVQGDCTKPGSWMGAVEGASALVHLAGESIAAGPWTVARKARLVDSRVESTRLLVRAVAKATQRPKLLVCASATGIYGPRGEEELGESAKPGHDFLAGLCRDWEAAAREGEGMGLEVVSMRFGVVLSARGGALSRMLPIFKLGLGGAIGPKGNWFPWVHEDDAWGLLRFALHSAFPDLAASGARGSALIGPVNAVAPQAVRMGEFAASLGRVLRRPAFFPIPIPLLRLALGELADGLSPGQKVRPEKALEAGYRFQHPELEGALRACLGKEASA